MSALEICNCKPSSSALNSDTHAFATGDPDTFGTLITELLQYADAQSVCKTDSMLCRVCDLNILEVLLVIIALLATLLYLTVVLSAANIYVTDGKRLGRSLARGHA